MKVNLKQSALITCIVKRQEKLIVGQIQYKSVKLNEFLTTLLTFAYVQGYQRSECSDN